MRADPESNELTIQEIKKAMGAHGAWKLKLSTAISIGSSKVTPADAKCDNLCEFGKWLHGPTLDLSIRSGMPYKVIKRLHAEFHIQAAQVLDLAVTGQKAEAQKLLEGDYTILSDKLSRALNKWRGELNQLSSTARRAS